LCEYQLKKLNVVATTSFPMIKRILRFFRNEDGPTAVEYAVMLAMILLVCLGAIVVLGEATQSLWESNEDGLQKAFDGNL